MQHHQIYIIVVDKLINISIEMCFKLCISIKLRIIDNKNYAMQCVYFKIKNRFTT